MLVNCCCDKIPKLKERKEGRFVLAHTVGTVHRGLEEMVAGREAAGDFASTAIKQGTMTADVQWEASVSQLSV